MIGRNRGQEECENEQWVQKRIAPIEKLAKEEILTRGRSVRWKLLWSSNIIW